MILFVSTPRNVKLFSASDMLNPSIRFAQVRPTGLLRIHALLNVLAGSIIGSIC
jgi:hypothetical protein